MTKIRRCISLATILLLVLGLSGCDGDDGGGKDGAPTATATTTGTPTTPPTATATQQPPTATATTTPTATVTQQPPTATATTTPTATATQQPPTATATTTPTATATTTPTATATTTPTATATTTPTATATTTPTTTPTEGVPPGFANADGINGGRLYDTFWARETGFDQNDPNLEVFEASSDFFRCKQCHAWDRLGNTASYIDRAPTTTRPNVSAVDLVEITEMSSPQQLFDAIKTGGDAPRRGVNADLSTYDPAVPATTTVGDQMPDYGEILSDEQIWDLVKYLIEETFDTTDLYEIMTEGTYPEGSRTFSDWGRDGDSENGDALYAQKCAVCHGDDGASGPFPIDDGELSVGLHLRSKPYETWHKVKFGQIGTAMGAQGINTLEEMKDLYKALADPVAYPDPGE